MVEGRGPRDAYAGWTPQQVEKLIRDLLNQCLMPLGREAGDEGLYAAYCTIEREDYERACEDLPELRGKGFAAICAEFVTCVALRLLPQDPAKPEGHRLGRVELTFDRGEAFQPAIEAAWQRVKDRPEGRRGPLSLVSKISSADWRDVPGLQAADDLAWHVNRWRTKGSIGANLRTVLPTDGTGAHFGCQQLIEWYRDSLDPLRLHATP